MERISIDYRGNSYPVILISLDKVSDISSSEIVRIADISLWDAIEDDYNDGVRDAVDLDNDIYFYCGYGVIDSFKSELDVIKYIENYI